MGRDSKLVKQINKAIPVGRTPLSLKEAGAFQKLMSEEAGRAYLRLVSLARQRGLEGADRRLYFEVNKYLYELKYGAPTHSLIGGSGGMTVFVFQGVSNRRQAQALLGQGNEVSNGETGQTEERHDDTERVVEPATTTES